MNFFYPCSKRLIERPTPQLNYPNVIGSVFYKGKRAVKNSIIQYHFKLFTATKLHRHNGYKVNIFETSRGEYYAQTIGGNYSYKLEKLTKEEANKIKFFNLFRHRG